MHDRLPSIGTTDDCKAKIHGSVRYIHDSCFCPKFLYLPNNGLSNTCGTFSSKLLHPSSGIQSAREDYPNFSRTFHQSSGYSAIYIVKVHTVVQVPQGRVYVTTPGDGNPTSPSIFSTAQAAQSPKGIPGSSHFAKSSAAFVTFSINYSLK